MFLPRAIGILLVLATHSDALVGGQYQPAESKVRPVFRFQGDRFDLDRTEDVRAFQAVADRLFVEADRREEEWERDGSELLGGRLLQDLGPAERRLYFQRPPSVFSKKERRGFEQLSQRLEELAHSDLAATRQQLCWEIVELAAAIENNRRSPIPAVGPGSAFMALDQLRNTVGGGHERALNVGHCGQDACDCAPPDSSFRRAVDYIPDQDLYSGFGRTVVPDWGGMTWEYRKPKTSRGANPGFEIRSGGIRAKAKFAETHSEPFTARVFHALGYNVDVTDHVASLKLKYDRRMLLELNLRERLPLDIRFFGLFTVASIDMQSTHNPFVFVNYVELKDGTLLSREEFKRRILVRSDLDDGEEILASGIDTDFENEVAFIHTVPANVQPDNPDVETIGPWRFDELGHDDLREVRAVGLLAAWLGWFDTRFDNTRLRVINGELVHCFSDLGSGLGKADAAFNWRPESPNEFASVFTEPPIVRGKGRMTTPFRVVNFHTIIDNEAFQSMTEEDARWMARLIGQFSRGQLVDALAASGYDATHTLFYLEKLVQRRNRMVEDLGMTDELGRLPRVFDESDFDYDPQVEKPGTDLPGSRFSTLPTGDSVVKSGILITRELN